MGWMCFPMHKPVKDWFIENIDKEKCEVLDVAIVNRNTLYGAIREKETGDVICVVYLIRWSPRSEYNFCYKSMSEFAGPGVIDCPLRILNLLTPLNDDKDSNGWAREWREKVKKYWEKKKSLNAKSVVIKVNEPITFTNGSSYHYFLKEKNRITAGVVENNKFIPYTRVNLRSIHKFDFEILKNVSV